MDPYFGRFETIPDATGFDGVRRKFSINKKFNNIVQRRVMHHFQQIANIFVTYGMDSVPIGTSLNSLNFFRSSIFFFSFISLGLTQFTIHTH